MLADEGTRVEKGQVLARLEETLARLTLGREEAAVAAQRANIARTMAELDKAKRDWDRYHGLEAKGSVSAAQLAYCRPVASLVQARSTQAQAELAAAEASLAVARENLKQMTIEAPFTGW